MITTATTTTGLVTIDDARPFIAEYDPANRWNGWLGQVRVDALTLVELFERADGEGIAFRWDGDTPTIVEYEGTEYEETVRVEVGDDGLYELGDLGWCFCEPTATYHEPVGIVYARCLNCGYGSADVTTLEIWNDLNGDCPECSEHHTEWLLADGEVRITSNDEEA